MSGCAPDDPLAGCTPLAREPLSAEQAAAIAPMLKAVADPVRLRLLSLVLSHQDGEACVCDLQPAFDLCATRATVATTLKVLHRLPAC